MRRLFPIVVVILLLALMAMVVWIANQLDFKPPQVAVGSVKSEIKPPPSPSIAASESLLEGYGDPANPAMEDLRKIQRVAVGYFSLVKDSTRFPIGGNEDFSAALQGENSNREIFIRRDHPVFSAAGLLIDRWGSLLIIHPQGWRQLELRSAGPDQIPYNLDDLVLSPAGASSR